MRVRIVQAFAIVALLHTITPFVDPATIGLDELGEHYGETIQLEGRVAEVEPSGDVVRVVIEDGASQATVLTRGQPPPLGASVSLRGQPSPGDQGPVVWAAGPIEATASPVAEDTLPLALVLEQAPRLVDRPVAVTGTWTDEGGALVGEAGRLPIDPAGIQPKPGGAIVWGELTYEPGNAGYELEATGWRPWSPPAR